MEKVKKGDKNLFNEAIKKVISNEEGLITLYQLLRETIRIYEYIGAYPEKVNYYDTYRELKIFSAGITRKIRPKANIPSDIKDELLKRIEFEEIKDIASVKFSHEKLEELIKSGKDYVIVADFLIPLLAYLEDKKEPIHRAIYKRLKELKDKYISRKISIQQLVKELEKSVKEIKNYEKLKKKQNTEDIVFKNLAFYLKNQGIEIEKTEQLTESIKNFLESKPTKNIEDKLKEAIICSLKEDKYLEKIDKIWDSLIEQVLIPMKEILKNA